MRYAIPPAMRATPATPPTTPPTMAPVLLLPPEVAAPGPLVVVWAGAVAVVLVEDDEVVVDEVEGVLVVWAISGTSSMVMIVCEV
jgi:hypothetical protein